MPEIPECLNRRYKALDELIHELSMNSRLSHHDNVPCRETDPGIKLMCDFWNILKEDPDYNLTQAVKQRMGLQIDGSVIKPQNIACFLAKNVPDDRKKGCCSERDQRSSGSNSARSPAVAGSDAMPLSKVLCNLKEAASFDKKCNAHINDLMKTQKELQDQITHLENREKEGVHLLKQADCMWSCMEEAYKKRLAESLKRQRDLMAELKEAEINNTKWRKNKKDLDSQVDRIIKCHKDIVEKISQKSNDIKCMEMEIADFKKRIENNKKEAEAAKKSVGTKKQASDAKIAKMAAEVSRLNKCLVEEGKKKQQKELEGSKYVKEAREDLHEISKVLLQKKIENEDRLAEKKAIEEEIELLKQTCEQCTDKCKNNQQVMIDEIKKLDKEIKEFKAKCIKCHQCTDTQDASKFCNDCPKCKQERECITTMDHCERDLAMDCVCTTVKHRFLDNVFENMYTVLARQSKTRPGKAVADAILKCLKNSRNGKLNVETRRILQDFILDAIKRNLNLTIVGGAVKTRCELDPETYNQLMTCLKKVTAVKPTKEDKGTAARKETCGRWGGTEDCNCPGGLKYCACSRKAPPPAKEPKPCPAPDKKKNDLKPGEMQACPNKAETPCGPDCYGRGPALEAELSTYRKDPCAPASCSFGTNMRAAQCVLEPENLNSGATFSPVSAHLPHDVTDYVDIKCKGCSNSMSSSKKERSRPRERIIEEVMGRDYTDVAPIERVASTDEHCEKAIENINRCICNKIVNGNTLEECMSGLRECSSDYILIEGTDALMEMLKRKKLSLVSTNDGNGTNVNMIKKLDPDTSTELKVKRDNLRVIFHPRTQKKSTKDDNVKHLRSQESKFGDAKKEYRNTGSYENYLNSNHLNPKCNNDSCIKRMFKAVIRSGNTDGIEITPDDSSTMKSLISLLCKSKGSSSINDLQRRENESVAKDTEELDDDYAKQLKEEVRQCCDRNSSTSSYQTIDEKEIESFLKCTEKVATKVPKKIVPDSKKNLVTCHEKCRKKQDKRKTNWKGEDLDDRFKRKQKMITRDEPITSNNNLSPSEELDFNLDANIIETNNRAIKDSNNIVIIKSNSSERYSVNLNAANDDSFKKNLPGTLSLEVKDFIKLILPDENISRNFSETANNTKELNLEHILKHMTTEEYGIVTTPHKEAIHFTESYKSFRRLKIKNDDNNDLAEPPVVLQITESNNFVLVPDKEYENEYNNTIKYFLEKDTEYYVKISQDGPNSSVVINFDEYKQPNAVLVRTAYDCLRIVRKSISECSITSSKREISGVIRDLFNKFPRMKNNAKTTSINLQAKSISDSNIYEKSKYLANSSDLLSESFVLRAINSGQYAVVLEKQSKIAFIKNLKNYLQKNPYGKVPVRKSNNGDITIVLNDNERDRVHYGSLKITPSGNIYVNIAEDVVKQLGLNKKPSETLSKHIIRRVARPKNKGVTTTCNAKSDQSSCDKSKCVCAELNVDKFGWRFGYVDESQREKNKLPLFRQLFVKTSDSESPENYSARTNVRTDCTCKPVNAMSRTEQCFYVIESSCPYHETLCDSEETVVVGRLHTDKNCRGTNKGYSSIITSSEMCRDDIKDWDSLIYLPPQLPNFLRDLELKYQCTSH